MALSVGLPWPAEDQLYSALIGSFVHDLADELAGVVRFDGLRLATLGHDLAQNTGYIFTFEALANMNGQAFPATAVHHGEHAQLASVKQVVGHEVHPPHLIDMAGQCLGLAQLGRFVAFGPLVAQAQVLSLIQAVDPFVVVFEALTP